MIFLFDIHFIFLLFVVSTDVLKLHKSFISVWKFFLKYVYICLHLLVYVLLICCVFFMDSNF